MRSDANLRPCYVVAFFSGAAIQFGHASRINLSYHTLTNTAILRPPTVADMEMKCGYMRKKRVNWGTKIRRYGDARARVEKWIQWRGIRAVSMGFSKRPMNWEAHCLIAQVDS